MKSNAQSSWNVVAWSVPRLILWGLCIDGLCRGVFRWDLECHPGKQATVFICRKRELLTVPKLVAVCFPSLLKFDFLAWSKLIKAIILEITMNNNANHVRSDERKHRAKRNTTHDVSNVNSHHRRT